MKYRFSQKKMPHHWSRNLPLRPDNQLQRQENQQTEAVLPSLDQADQAAYENKLINIIATNTHAEQFIHESQVNEVADGSMGMGHTSAIKDLTDGNCFLQKKTDGNCLCTRSSRTLSSRHSVRTKSNINLVVYVLPP